MRAHSSRSACSAPASDSCFRHAGRLRSGRADCKPTVRRSQGLSCTRNGQTVCWTSAVVVLVHQLTALVAVNPHLTREYTEQKQRLENALEKQEELLRNPLGLRTAGVKRKSPDDHEEPANRTPGDGAAPTAPNGAANGVVNAVVNGVVHNVVQQS